VSSIGYIIGG